MVSENCHFIYVHDQNVSWLIELPYWFKAGFCLKFWEFRIHNMKNIILGEARFNPCVARLSQRLVIRKTGILKLYGFFEFSDGWFNLR